MQVEVKVYLDEYNGKLTLKEVVTGDLWVQTASIMTGEPYWIPLEKK